MRIASVAALAVVVVLATSACGGHRSHVSIEVSPVSATFDVPFTIHVRGLSAGARALVIFSGRTREGRTVRDQVAVHADARGEVELADQYPYAHLDPAAGWPQTLKVTVSSARATAATRAMRRPLAASRLLTTELRPATVGFYGAWIRPRRTHRHTAILLLGGSEGGVPAGPFGTTLAAHGYPVLELAYFAVPGLPQSLERIPLEYFERALTWLAKQPAADPRRVVTVGWSFGGEASLLIASTYPRLVRAAVGYVPSASINGSPAGSSPAWTLHGKPVYGDTTNRLPYTWGWIRVERIVGPVFVVGGGADHVWASGSFVAKIKQRMLAHHRRDITALVYPRAGHLIYQAVPRQVDVSSADYGYVTTRYGVVSFGGSPHADEAALEASWPKLLAFLARVGSH